MKVSVLVVAIVLAGGRGAMAADSAEAESLISQGIALRQQGRDEKALPLFQKAYGLVPSPRTAGQLGFAEMAVGYWLDAEQHLNEALETPDHPWVAKNHDTINQALARIRSNIGEIAIVGPPPGATVSVNRHPTGTFPLSGPIRAGKGRVDVEVTAPGYVTAKRSLHVGGADRQQLTISLERVSAATTGEPMPPEKAAPTSTAPTTIPAATRDPAPAPGAAAIPAIESSDHGSGVHRKLAWGLGLTAGAALVGAVVETLIWQSKRSEFNRTTGCYEDQLNHGAAGCNDLFESAHLALTIAIVGYIAAGALAGGSAALFLTDKPSESHAHSALTCAPGVGKSLVTCHLSF